MLGKAQWQGAGASAPAADSAARLAECAGLRLALADILADRDFRWLRAVHDAGGRSGFALVLELLTSSPPAPPAALESMLNRLRAYAVQNSAWIAEFAQGGNGDE